MFFNLFIFLIFLTLVFRFRMTQNVSLFYGGLYVVGYFGDVVAGNELPAVGVRCGDLHLSGGFQLLLEANIPVLCLRCLLIF
jgi:hypothetical protein